MTRYIYDYFQAVGIYIYMYVEASCHLIYIRPRYSKSFACVIEIRRSFEVRIRPVIISLSHLRDLDRLCGLVVRVPGYRSRGSEFDSRRYQIF
jgi:hypothetical protein